MLSLLGAVAGAATPNILLIVADDMGYGDLGCYGCPDIRTPNLDRLAAEGVRLTNFYANGPECTPTRTALMTGRYQHRVGGLECAIGTGNVGRYDDAIRLAARHDLGLPASEATVVRLLKGVGYTAVAYGKWHLGYERKFSPIRHGFDHYFGPLGGGVDYYFHCEWDGTHMLYENEREVYREGYLTDLITQSAVDFLRRHDGSRPFFLYLPYTAPHTPLQRPGQKPERPRTQENWNQGTREDYVAVLERLDEGIGRVLATLQRRGFAQETLVIFFSDNGGTRLARNAPFSGYKGGLFEGGIREPCIMRMPGVLPAGVVSHQVAISFDLSKSIVRVAGAREPADRPFDGIDIVRHIASRRPDMPRTLFWRARRGQRTWRAVRDGTLKYLSRQDGQQVSEYLFDLARDPGEQDNLLDAQPDEVRRLKRRLAQWEKEVRPAR